ncbi:MAG: aminoacyl-tRNA hydrolase [Rickettsiales bacterium]|nr:MAG: aminoacyl-tRNA hydrolase [Rickettsiales bacterium]
MLLIVGLGNLGTKYQNTRHNVGFMAVDLISDRYNLDWSTKSKFDADIASGECELGKIILCKPNTYMNLSGISVQKIKSFYNIPISDIIVIHDDIDVLLEKTKYKLGGGAGGHNGLKSIDSAIGKDYHRIRVGIGRPENPNHDVSDYVLGKFGAREEISIMQQLTKLEESIKLLADKDTDKFKAAISK